MAVMHVDVLVRVQHYLPNVKLRTEHLLLGGVFAEQQD